MALHAGLGQLREDCTKSDIIDAIINRRNEADEPPPSSPSGRTEAHSSGYSSDDGHDGGGEETDIGRLQPKSPLRRRVTIQDTSRSVDRPSGGRTFSLNIVGGPGKGAAFTKKARMAKDVKSPCHASLTDLYVDQSFSLSLNLSLPFYC